MNVLVDALPDVSTKIDRNSITYHLFLICS